MRTTAVFKSRYGVRAVPHTACCWAASCGAPGPASHGGGQGEGRHLPGCPCQHSQHKWPPGSVLRSERARIRGNSAWEEPASADLYNSWATAQGSVARLLQDWLFPPVSFVKMLQAGQLYEKLQIQVLALCLEHGPSLIPQVAAVP